MLGATQDRLIDSQTAVRLKALRQDLECVMLDAPHFLLQRAPAAAAAAIAEFLSRPTPIVSGAANWWVSPSYPPSPTAIRICSVSTAPGAISITPGLSANAPSKPIGLA
jgi:hypothetical protein